MGSVLPTAIIGSDCSFSVLDAMDALEVLDTELPRLDLSLRRFKLQKPELDLSFSSTNSDSLALPTLKCVLKKMFCTSVMNQKITFLFLFVFLLFAFLVHPDQHSVVK